MKNLANQTARATEDITAQIGEIRNVSESAVVAIRGIGDTIGRISTIATSIASAVEAQGAATSDIANSVQNAAMGTRTVSDSIDEVSRAATHVSEIAGLVLESASALSAQSQDLHAKLAGFVSSIRAA
ncbi:MAG: hypothetical protein U1F43_30555 [Myxococcota bacterium]